MIFSQVYVAEWPPFERKLLITLTVCCLLLYCNFSYFLLWFEGRDFGSDCISSWSLLTFFFVYFHIQNNFYLDFHIKKVSI